MLKGHKCGTGPAVSLYSVKKVLRLRVFTGIAIRQTAENVPHWNQFPARFGAFDMAAGHLRSTAWRQRGESGAESVLLIVDDSRFDSVDAGFAKHRSEHWSQLRTIRDAATMKRIW
ncbi:hypothetical protein [Rhizobium sp. Root1203]|uniref:hypothetical protein n=1 Tax=Rhizobium sp. Root1203 TaxID=1736427 RepID=UPI0012E3AF7E|nr:hypothetical protein [Rhizobium sp. Root1203]